MLFNSYEFIFAYLPIVFLVYFGLVRARLLTMSRAWLVIASLFFYAWWSLEYLPLIVGSIVFNFYLGQRVGRSAAGRHKQFLLLLGVSFNVGLLGYYKYTDFFIENFNFALGTDMPLQHIVLPLAISYFTFQQIAYVVDSYRGETQEYNFLNYCLFISFFPQLLMGPIVHHKEMLPQFENRFKLVLRPQNIALGLFLFSMGLAKKTLLGDPLTEYGQSAFDSPESLTASAAWFGSLSYVLAYYFDLSGYADMAIGVSRFFNIDLPSNFNSPYKSRNFAEYWRRWHMTLSRFLGDYVYKNLGGNRKLAYTFYLNIILTFLVSGIWHGSGWTFFIWGLVNGIFVAMSHGMRRNGLALNFYLAWTLTFLGVILTRVLFVASSFEDAWTMFEAMFNIPALVTGLVGHAFAEYQQTAYLLLGLGLSLFARNSLEIAGDYKPNLRYALYTGALMAASILTLSETSEFLYFQF